MYRLELLMPAPFEQWLIDAGDRRPGRDPGGMERPSPTLSVKPTLKYCRRPGGAKPWKDWHPYRTPGVTCWLTFTQRAILAWNGNEHEYDRYRLCLDPAGNGGVDPEIPVLTVADLGIIRDVHLTEGGVEVVITPPIPVVRPCTHDRGADHGIERGQFRGCEDQDRTQSGLDDRLDHRRRDGPSSRNSASPHPGRTRKCPTVPNADPHTNRSPSSIDGLQIPLAMPGGKEPFDHFKCH